MLTNIGLLRSSVTRALIFVALLPAGLFLSEPRALGFCRHQQSTDGQQARAKVPDPWTTDAIMPAEKLAQRISGASAGGQIILYVGPAALYKRSHIPGAKFIGLTSQPEGLSKLGQEAEKINVDSELVIYCGCCPWDVCPNIRPAFAALSKRGFKKVSVLNLPETFRQDWVNKGFPVATGDSL